MLFTRIAILSFFIVFSSFVVADTIYVDVNAGGLNNGSSWDDAYTTIQSGIDNSLNGDVVIVAEGLYSENIDLGGMGIVLRSTDPNDPNVVAATILDGGGSGSVVTCNSGETVDTVINGFWIQNGDGSSNSFGGGGVYCDHTDPVIMNCVIISNSVTNYGGGVFCYYGSPSLLSCKFFGNSALYGAGLGCYRSNVTVKSCVFSGNVSSSYGGGLYALEASPELMNCTFSQNSSNFGGAIYCSQGSPMVVNSILWGNGQEIYSQSSALSLDYCTVEDGWSGSGSNNVIIAPGFIDPDGDDGIPGTADDDLSLDPFSLCINAGDPFGDYEGLMDMDGQARSLYGQVDIGADEVFPIGADLDESGQVDTDDLSEFAAGWLVDVDMSDFVFFAEQWLYGVESEIVE